MPALSIPAVALPRHRKVLPSIETIDAEFRTTRNANVRDAPSITGRKLATLPLGSKVAVLGKVKGTDWYAIELNDGKRAYVHAGLLEEAGTATQQIAAAKPQKPLGGTTAKPAVGVFPKRLKPGDVFRDCDECPEMVVVPAGSFMMGSNKGESDEKPVHRIVISAPFAVSKFEVKNVEFAQFVRETQFDAGSSCQTIDGGYGDDQQAHSWRRPGYPPMPSQPVTCVNWDDAQAYVAWLRRKTGQPYRLLSEAEWEHTARAGSTSKYSFGDASWLLCAHGNGLDITGVKKHADWRFATCEDGYADIAPVGQFQANAYGVHDMHGNVWEWVED